MSEIQMDWAVAYETFENNGDETTTFFAVSSLDEAEAMVARIEDGTTKPVDGQWNHRVAYRHMTPWRDWR